MLLSLKSAKELVIQVFKPYYFNMLNTFLIRTYTFLSILSMTAMSNHFSYSTIEF